jgi:guanylate kinase
LLDIDVQGAASLKKLYGVRCFTVFVAPPSLETLEKRLRARGTDSEEVVAKRMRNAEIEMKAATTFDRIIINDDLGRASQELLTLVAQRLTPHSRAPSTTAD